jgi:hypothetical protein
VDTFIINISEADRFWQLLRNFDWKLVDPTKPMKSACYGIFVMSDLWVIVTERPTKSLNECANRRNDSGTESG